MTPERAQALAMEAPRNGDPGQAPVLAAVIQGKDPEQDPDDPTVWPNRASRANSDPWLVVNHDKIRQMRPRVLLVNFSNEHDRGHLTALAEEDYRGSGESSRHHGDRDPRAPAFLDYQIFKLVDLRDADRRVGNSRKFPYKDMRAKTGFNTNYQAFFSDEFAEHYQVVDPNDAGTARPQGVGGRRIRARGLVLHVGDDRPRRSH